MYRLNTVTHVRTRLGIHLYICSLMESMENYNGEFFSFCKSLDLKFQLESDSTISLIGI